MLDFFDLPGNGYRELFVGGSNPNSIPNPYTWQKPRGCSMIYILCVGPGGNGGNGAVGAASTAAGGGGGASGGFAAVVTPAALIPDVLYLYPGVVGATESGVTFAPTQVSATGLGLLWAPKGNNGNNAAGGVAGTGGTVGVLAPARHNGLGLTTTASAGIAGVAGNATGAPGSHNLATTGTIVTPGTGGAGVGNAASTGAAGGSINSNGEFPAVPGGTAPGSQTVPAGDGRRGYSRPVGNALFFSGGSGGASTGGAATGAGLKAGNGGDAAPGCGGGGGGGGFTGSTQGIGGKGGPGFIYIIAW